MNSQAAKPLRLGDLGREPAPRRGRLLGVMLSVTAHVLVLVALFSVHASSPPLIDPGPMTAELVNLAPPAVETAPPAAQPSPPQASSAGSIVRPSPRPPPAQSHPLPTAHAKAAESIAELGDAQLVGAASADGGGGGGECDMAKRVQSALRKDTRVQEAVAAAHRAAAKSGKAILVWDGDWVRSGDEDGKGLAEVREAIMWEVAFAPAACRAQTVHGLILFSLSDSPAFVRLAVGSGDWRWSDLLKLR